MKDGSCTGAMAPTTWIVEEVGLTNRQVWAAALEWLGARSRVSRMELDTWLRPAALVGREGNSLVIGVSTRVAQERVTRVLVPRVRDALDAVLGVGHDVRVVVNSAEQVA